MKHNYLNVNPNKLYRDFPQTPLFDDMIKFLKSSGFGNGTNVSIDKIDVDADTFVKEKSKRNNSNEYCYDVVNNSKTVYWMRFCNHGMDTKNTPILFCYVAKNPKLADNINKMLDELRLIITADFIAYDITNQKAIYTWEDFKEIFIKTFNIKQ